jgi:hypothetical protein
MAEPQRVPAAAAAAESLPRRSGEITQYVHGRVCLDTGCATRLSTYNASMFCWVHQGRAPASGRVLRP